MKIQSIAYLVFVTIAGSVLPGAAQSGMAEMRSSSGSNIYSYELAYYPTGDQRCEGIAADLAVKQPYWNPRPFGLPQRDEIRGLLQRAFDGSPPVYG